MPQDLFETADVRKLTRGEFNAMLEAGVLDPEDGINEDVLELIDGLVVRKPRQSPEHARAIRRLNKMLMRVLVERDDLELDVQNPFAADDYNEPKPDFALIAQQGEAPDLPDRAFLMIEVSRSRLRFDRIIKHRMYARIGVPEYWIVNVDDQVVEVYREPTPDGYGSVELRRVGEEIHPAAFPELSVTVADLFGPPKVSR